MAEQPSNLAWIRATMARFEAPLLRRAIRITRDPERARDVVQETFLRLCQADRAEVEDRLAAWLYTVCRNLAVDVVRKENRMQPLSERARDSVPSDAPAPPAVVERTRRASRVLTLVADLPDRQREVLRLKFQDGLSYREIGAITGDSVSNVGYLIHTAVSALRARIASEGDDRAAAMAAAPTGGTR